MSILENKNPEINSGGITIDGDFFIVLINSEGQYSLWPASKNIPEGWFGAGFEGNKAQCSEFIERVWVDMRPKSISSNN